MSAISSRPQTAPNDSDEILKQCLYLGSDWQRLLAEARRRCCGMNKLVRLAIAEWLKNHEGMPPGAQGSE